jgi:protein phosphatase-4 regulatory subunit 3
LLQTKIGKDEGYQKQQGFYPAISARKNVFFADVCITRPETLIVWTEPNGTDMALSFQEAEGCAVIW